MDLKRMKERMKVGLIKGRMDVDRWIKVNLMVHTIDPRH